MPIELTAEERQAAEVDKNLSSAAIRAAHIQGTVAVVVAVLVDDGAPGMPLVIHRSFGHRGKELEEALAAVLKPQPAVNEA